jgi:hypothetical protein
LKRNQNISLSPGYSPCLKRTCLSLQPVPGTPRPDAVQLRSILPSIALAASDVPPSSTASFPGRLCRNRLHRRIGGCNGADPPHHLGSLAPLTVRGSVVAKHSIMRSLAGRLSEAQPVPEARSSARRKQRQTPWKTNRGGKRNETKCEGFSSPLGSLSSSLSQPPFSRSL